MSKISERHKGVIRFPQREGSLQGEVKEYVLSPEELAKYRALPMPEEAKKKQQKKISMPATPKEPLVKKEAIKKPKPKINKPKPKPIAEPKKERKTKIKVPDRFCTDCKKKINKKNRSGKCKECKGIKSKCVDCGKELAEKNWTRCMACKKIPKVCSAVGCDENAKVKGMCIKHYNRFKKHGNTIGRVCSLDGCENKHVNLGYCDLHHKRFKKHGNPHYLKKQFRPGNWVLIDERTGQRVEIEQS